MRQEVIAFVGVGSNLNGSLENCQEAVRRVGALPGVELLRVSSWYRTEPVGFRDQDWFINAVLELRTRLTARALLLVLQGIEAAMGRVRGRRWGPRVIDLDILLYGQEVIRELDLTVPHPELHLRGFVLIPLCEIAAAVIHPAFGVSLRGLLLRLEDTSRVERL
jgi:2-amino-4-hydroxy-6-hydroxymethyldihydropteridine diphosphokinase